MYEIAELAAEAVDKVEEDEEAARGCADLAWGRSGTKDHEMDHNDFGLPADTTEEGADVVDGEVEG